MLFRERQWAAEPDRSLLLQFNGHSSRVSVKLASAFRHLHNEIREVRENLGVTLKSFSVPRRSVVDFRGMKNYINTIRNANENSIETCGGEMTRGSTILFIEDEDELRQSISQLLSEQGFGVIAVPRAEDALQHMIDHHPDLIIADIKLPGIDGFEFFAQMKANKEWQDIPVVFLTAFNNLQATVHAKELGVKEYITKPFEFEYLVARIRALLVP